MGVINLGLLVDKIKRKLENSGFIKNTDYATATAAGVVQIGDNIEVTEAGVISVPTASEETAGVIALGDIPTGGITLDLLWNGTTTATATSIKDSILHPINDYKMIAATSINASGNNGSTGGGSVLPTIQTYTESATYYFALTKVVVLTWTPSDVTIMNQGTGSQSGVYIYGIK